MLLSRHSLLEAQWFLQELYSGTVDCAMKMMKSEGPSAFFAGAIPRCVQAMSFGGRLKSDELQIEIEC